MELDVLEADARAGVSVEVDDEGDEDAGDEDEDVNAGLEAVVKPDVEAEPDDDADVNEPGVVVAVNGAASTRAGARADSDGHPRARGRRGRCQIPSSERIHAIADQVATHAHELRYCWKSRTDETSQTIKQTESKERLVRVQRMTCISHTRRRATKLLQRHPHRDEAITAETRINPHRSNRISETGTVAVTLAHTHPEQIHKDGRLPDRRVMVRARQTAIVRPVIDGLVGCVEQLLLVQADARGTAAVLGLVLCAPCPAPVRRELQGQRNQGPKRASLVFARAWSHANTRCCVCVFCSIGRMGETLN